MFNRLSLLISVLTLTCIQRSFAQTDSVKIAGEIIRLEQKLADALPVDTNIWGKYLDKNWYIVDEDGNISSRMEFLATFKPFPKEVSINVKVTRPVFSIHGDVVVIHYVADEHEAAYGQNLHTTYGTMDTWYRKGDSWMMLSMQDFEIPALPPAVKVDPSTLQKYTGTYELMAGKTAVVSLKNDTLFIQKGTGKPVPLFAETATVFFRTADARGRKIFVATNNGMVMLERRNGQDLAWKKINN